MLHPKTTSLLLLVVICGACSSATAQTLSQVVASFYPVALGTSGNQESCYDVATTNPDGSPALVAAGYSNGVQGAVLLLQSTALGQFSMASQVSGFDFPGTACSALAVDLDGDGVNEVVISFYSPRGNTMDWVFRVTGTTLTNLSPVTSSAGVTTTTLMDIGIIDIFHDGTLQIEDTGEYPPPADGSLPTSSNSLYSVGANGLVPMGDVYFLWEFDRENGPPQMEQRSFTIPASVTQQPKTLRITNGSYDGTHRVSSAQIWVNGVPVALPSAFNQTVEFLSIPLGTLPSQNIITVQLASAPGSKIIVTVQ